MKRYRFHLTLEELYAFNATGFHAVSANDAELIEGFRTRVNDVLGNVIRQQEIQARKDRMRRAIARALKKQKKGQV